MKISLIPVISLGLSLTCLANQSFGQSSNYMLTNPDSLQAVIKFDTTVLNSDTITEGTIYKFIYHYANIGNAPLVLKNVRSSCGCYVPQWNKRPLAPGGRDSIVGIYSSRGRPGRFTKSMTVECNSSSTPRVILYCKGYALRKPPIGANKE